MRLLFDPNQDFQLQAIEAVTGLLEGQGRVAPDVVSALERGFAAVANRLDLIDRVDNYAAQDGVIRRLFDKAFNELKQFPNYSAWKEVDAASVQEAYFAQKRRKGGGVDLVDSVSGKTKEDEAAYDLIMKKKEQLLSLDEPVAFIFSHSALRGVEALPVRGGRHRAKVGLPTAAQLELLDPVLEASPPAVAAVDRRDVHGVHGG